MNEDIRFGRAVDAFLADTAPSYGPQDLFDEIFLSTSRIRPRPRWLALLKEPTMRYDSHLVTGSPALRLAAIVAMTVSLVLGLTAMVAGAATLLPSPSADDGPHNGLIAFDSNGDIWVAEPDGRDRRQLTFDAAAGRGRDWGPVWSPDGSMLAYTRDGSGSAPAGIDIIDVDGHEVASVAQFGRGFCTCRTEDPDWSAYDGRPSWAPDSRRVAYSIFVPKGYGYHQVFVRALDATNSETLDPSGSDPLERGTGPVWSPEGTRIAYVRPDAPGSLVVMSLSPRGRSIVESASTEPAWSPDGRRIAYAVKSEDDYDIAIADLDGSGERTIVSEPTDERWPAWSPDGRRIAYVRADAESAAHRVVIVDVTQGEGSRRVLDIPGVVDAPPVWSPDGSQLAIWVQPVDDGRAGGLTIVDLTDATRPVTIPADSETFRASWQSTGAPLHP
jgi:TolB protein